MVKTQKAGAVMLLAIVAQSSSAPANEPAACGEFTVWTEIIGRELVDHPPKGSSAGDQRLFTALVRDAQGREIGEAFTTATVMPQDQQGRFTTLVNRWMVLDDGAIHTTKLAYPPDAGDISQTPEHKVIGTIVGGTGIYAHASGTVAGQKLEPGKRQSDFNIACR